jgi:hypothetical protein
MLIYFIARRCIISKHKRSVNFLRHKDMKKCIILYVIVNKVKIEVAVWALVYSDK